MVEVVENGAVELGAMLRNYGEEKKGRVDKLLLYLWSGQFKRR